MSATGVVEQALPRALDEALPSWEEIVQQHSGRVYRLAYRLTGNHADAEDLTQETFVRVFRSLHTYTPGTFEGWLHRITTNLFLDQARRRSRLRVESIHELQLASDWQDRPERQFEHANLAPDVQRALDALPPGHRAAVVLCDIEGYSYAEVAATPVVELGPVQSWSARGPALLREQLAHRQQAGSG